MGISKRGVLFIAISTVLIASLVVIALPTAPAGAAVRTDLIDTDLSNLTIIRIGDGIGDGTLASQVVDQLEVKGAGIVSLSSIPEAAELNPEVGIIFDGEWFEGRAHDKELHDFLKVASSRGASMVMVGGTTSKFFETLDEAGVYEIPVTETGIVRNPAHDNPPLAGLKMKMVNGHMAPSFLFSYESNPEALAESLTGWLPLTAPLVLAEPYLQFVTEYYYAPLLAEDPYGKLNVIVPIYKLTDDGVPDHDWYFYQVRVQSVPGCIAYSSKDVNEHTWAQHQVYGTGTYRWLVDYDSTTTSGTTTVGVSISALAAAAGPSVGFTWSWSYDVPDVIVLDQSDFSEHRAYWQHDIDREAPVAQNTYLSKPGFVVQTTQDTSSLVDACYSARFVHPNLFHWAGKTLESPTLYLDAFQAGD